MKLSAVQQIFWSNQIILRKGRLILFYIICVIWPKIHIWCQMTHITSKGTCPSGLFLFIYKYLWLYDWLSKQELGSSLALQVCIYCSWQRAFFINIYGHILVIVWKLVSNHQWANNWLSKLQSIHRK